MDTEKIGRSQIACYDNKGETADRYTVLFMDTIQKTSDGYVFDCVGMSDCPFHPQGFYQHSVAQAGRHLGRRIAFKDLPVDCRKAIRAELKGVKSWGK